MPSAPIEIVEAVTLQQRDEVILEPGALLSSGPASTSYPNLTRGSA